MVFGRYSSTIKMNKEVFATVSYVTTPNQEVARNLAKVLVEKRVAACVNIVNNVESIYEWQGKLEQDSESMMIIKSNSEKSAALKEIIEKEHPYDCPEVITLEVKSGSEKYINWIHETLDKKPL